MENDSIVRQMPRKDYGYIRKRCEHPDCAKPFCGEPKLWNGHIIELCEDHLFKFLQYVHSWRYTEKEILKMFRL